MHQQCGAFAMRSRSLPKHSTIKTKHCTFLDFLLGVIPSLLDAPVLMPSRCRHHLSGLPLGQQTFQVCHMVQLCDPVLSFDQRVLSCPVAACSKSCKRWSTCDVWSPSMDSNDCSATMTHTYVVVRSKQTSEEISQNTTITRTMSRATPTYQKKKKV